MGTTVSVIVQPPYLLSDDKGSPLVPGNGTYKVQLTDTIQKYIDLGMLTIVPAIDEPVEVESVEETPEAPVKKTRTSAQKQENLDG